MNCEKCGSDCYHIETGNSSTGQIAIIHCEHCEWRSEIEQLKSENQKLKAALEREKACVDFYADIESWEEFLVNDPIDRIVDTDIVITKDYTNGVGGKLARQTQAARDKE